MILRTAISTLCILTLFQFLTSGTPCDSNKALQELISSLNVDSGSWKSSYASTAEIKLGSRKTKAITYVIEGLETRDQLAVLLFENISNCKYRFSILDTFYQEGVLPEILSIFNVNADNDKAQELAVLIAWHYDDLNFRGYLYKVSFYDYPKSDKDNHFHLIESVSDLFPIEGKGSQMAKDLHAKYNTEAKIRRRLKQLGFRQQ